MEGSVRSNGYGIYRFLSSIEGWLHRCIEPEPVEIGADRTFRLLLRVIVRTFVPLFLYGGLMGTWGMWNTGSFSADQWTQVIFSALKVPLLLAATFVLSLPSFFVLYALAGLAHDFRRILFLLIDTQGIFAVVLLSLSPFTLLFYGSTTSYVDAVLFNAALFGIAASARQISLRRRYQEMLVRDHRHQVLLRFWFVLYAFVGVQVAWLLRPFIGVPGGDPIFIRQEGWGNAYIEVLNSIITSLAGN